MGGYYAARAGCYEHRLAAAISHGAIWSLSDMWGNKGDDFGLAMHIRWVLGAKTMAEAHEKMVPFTLEGHLEHMRCPYLIVHGGHDVLTVSAARKTYDHAKANGVDVTLRILDPDETGAEHCQHDNPTIGQEDPVRLARRPLRHRPAGPAEALVEPDDLTMTVDLNTRPPGHRRHRPASRPSRSRGRHHAARGRRRGPRVVAANARFFDWARGVGIPIFHCVATYRDATRSPPTRPGGRVQPIPTIRARTCSSTTSTACRAAK